MASDLEDDRDGRLGRSVVMGVSGCGKGTVGRALADVLGLRFIDGDALHPTANIAQMGHGEPLDNEDRKPWLNRVGQSLADGTVIACSALKRSYRHRIQDHVSGRVVFQFLRGRRETLAERMRCRQGHFMPATLLDSQLNMLEEPAADEPAVTIEIDNALDQILAEIVLGFQRVGGCSHHKSR